MAAITTDDVIFLGVVSLLAGWQLGRFARRVGKARGKFKVQVPDVQGDAVFNRTFRAHQNCIEFFPLFMTAFWMAGIFFHQVPASLVALVYLYSRQKYYDGYIKSAEDRLPGFMLGLKTLFVLILLAGTGITHAFLLSYFDINLKMMAFSFVK